MTALLLKAIRESRRSLYAIAQDTGIDKAALGRFVAGKQSLRLDRADKLADHFGLALRKVAMDQDSKRKFWAAIMAVDDALVGAGYINKRTYNVALLSSLPENYALDDEAGVEELTPDAMEDRRRIKSNPDDWIEIPKYDRAAQRRYGEPTKGNLKRFAQDFFSSEGLNIEAE